MDSTIIAKGIDANRSLREYVKESIASALTHEKDYIDHVTVRLSDTNGTKGGLDKRCLINVKLRGKPDIVITEVASDVKRAIDKAVYRTSIAADRMASRVKSISHTTMPIYMKSLYKDKYQLAI